MRLHSPTMSNKESRNNGKVMIPEPTVRRLPWYLAHVRMLASQGIAHVSSTQIASVINVDSSQIAKDLSFLNIKGKTRIGYDVSQLKTELEAFLGFTGMHRAVMVGTGSLGSALMQDRGLMQYGLHIVAGFDVDDAVVGTSIAGTPVYHLSQLPQLQQQLDVSIAVLAVPAEQAQRAADDIIAAGVKAIWNFTPFRIKAPAHIVIQNTSIYAHLALIYNRLGQSQKARPVRVNKNATPTD